MAAIDSTFGGRSGAGKLRAGLSAACTLLGISALPAQATEFAAAALYYQEPNRVSAFETVLEGRHDLGGGRLGSFKLVLDALTGPSANGATPASQVQTFTRPSGSGRYTVAPGDTPLDDTFHDSRAAVSADLSLPWGRLSKVGFGARYSGEHDYTSLGGSLSFSHDLDRRNTTLSAALNYARDSINPEGGRPLPLAAMAAPHEAQPRLADNGAKDVTDVVLGVTQVIDRATLAQVNYSYGQASGYQTDPYKLLSVVDGSNGEPDHYVFESRPESRTRQALFGQVKRHLGGSVLDTSYRYYFDDWGVRSHTVDLRWRLPASSTWFLQPHLRYYHQGAADFYRRYLVVGETLPDAATADYRLGQFDAYTVGLEYGRNVGNQHQFTVRAEYYWQQGDNHPAGAPGALAQQDLFPTLDAMILQIGYSLDLL